MGRAGSYGGGVVYRVLADATMIVHFAFVVYVVVGGFLAWRWPRSIVPHLIAAGWGLVISVFSLACPLTPLEDRLRRLAGEEGLPGGFIDTYIEGVLYPERFVEEVRLAVAVVVAVSWVGLLVRRHRRASAGAAA